MVRRAHLRRPARAGFSLLEVMMAVSIIAIALMGLMSVIASCVTLDRDTQELNTAMWQAKQMIENIKAQGFVSVADYVDTSDNDGLGPNHTGVVANFGSFDVPGLTPQTTDSDGFNPHLCGKVMVNSITQGAVVIPFANGVPPMPWVFNAADTKYELTVLIEWSGAMGDREIALHTIIGNY